jgi:DNA-binding GntR family transcriptional regulator
MVVILLALYTGLQLCIPVYINRNPGVDMTAHLIASELRTDLVEGTLRPGAELSQVELAKRFGVSRIPVRDALQILAGEGLVDIHPVRGARAIELSPKEIREIYDLRVLLECDCLRHAANTLTAADLDDIERIRRKSDIDATTPDWKTADWAFHRAIYSRAERPRQVAMIERLRRTCEVYVAAYSTIPKKMPRWLAGHRQIVQYLREGEVELAAEALRAHLEGAAEHLLTKMTEEQPHVL